MLRLFSQTRLLSTQRHVHLSENCIFCKIIKQQIPSLKLLESDKSVAFMDIDPLSEGHALVIPKHHAEFLHQVPDDYLSDLLPMVKKIAKAGGYTAYNVLQNNGALAHQAVPHVHFHLIPKPDRETGLGIRWQVQVKNQRTVQTRYETLRSQLLSADHP
ncbi:HIT-like domain-containing protein [Sporodiniella umbellata]|nr:HIT-like domain-containing protein [Sporodiniella umbellata]